MTNQRELNFMGKTIAEESVLLHKEEASGGSKAI
jgi:hypothetical protein